MAGWQWGTEKEAVVHNERRSRSNSFESYLSPVFSGHMRDNLRFCQRGTSVRAISNVSCANGSLLAGQPVCSSGKSSPLLQLNHRQILFFAITTSAHATEQVGEMNGCAPAMTDAPPVTARLNLTSAKTLS